MSLYLEVFQTPCNIQVVQCFYSSKALPVAFPVAFFPIFLGLLVPWNEGKQSKMQHFFSLHCILISRGVCIILGWNIFMMWHMMCMESWLALVVLDFLLLTLQWHLKIGLNRKAWTLSMNQHLTTDLGEGDLNVNQLKTCILDVFWGFLVVVFCCCFFWGGDGKMAP